MSSAIPDDQIIRGAEEECNRLQAEVTRLEGIIHRHSCDSEYEMMRLDSEADKLQSEVARLEMVVAERDYVIELNKDGHKVLERARDSFDDLWQKSRAEVARLKSAWADEAHAASDDMAEYRSAVEYRDAEVTRLEMVIRDIGDTLYGQNLEVMGYHLNGNPKPMDEFFHESNWLEDE